jgi:hypothetical protein
MHPDTFLHGVRTPWDAAPLEVQAWVLTRTGPFSGEPRNCVGGMATGVAAVLQGREQHVFVKALDAAANPRGAWMYQREAELALKLPRHSRIPTLLEAGPVRAGDGEWWVSLFQARSGSTPQHPWIPADLDQVLVAWAGLRSTLAATPWNDSAQLSDFFNAWRRIATDPGDPWHRLAPHWVGREVTMSQHVDGGEQAVLSHIDLRADNILISPRIDEVAFLDWAHPGTAAPWADVAILLSDVVASGASTESGGDIDVIDSFAHAEPGTDVEMAITLISALAAFLHLVAHREQSNKVMPHRLRWSAAASQQMLSFVEAHTR